MLRFGNFEVLTRPDGRPVVLGGGAFGKTYQARHVFLERIVALKVIHERFMDDPRAQERFRREAQSAHELTHPHIAEVLDYGQHEGAFYYAMEYLGGGDLDEFVRSHGALDAETALHCTRQMAEALCHAHGRGFLHRDLKPSNVMLAGAEGPPCLKLIDFGLVKRGAMGDATLTLTGEVLGTPLFASPEQLREEEQDARSDLFSLGMTLWFLLEGRAPLQGSSATLMAERLSAKSYKRKLGEHVPPALRPFLSRLIEKRPARRFQSGEEVITALDVLRDTLSGGTASAPLPADEVCKEEEAALSDPTYAPLRTGTLMGLGMELAALKLEDTGECSLESPPESNAPSGVAAEPELAPPEAGKPEHETLATLSTVAGTPDRPGGAPCTAPNPRPTARGLLLLVSFVAAMLALMAVWNVVHGDASNPAVTPSPSTVASSVSRQMTPARAPASVAKETPEAVLLMAAAFQPVVQPVPVEEPPPVRPEPPVGLFQCEFEWKNARPGRAFTARITRMLSIYDGLKGGSIEDTVNVTEPKGVKPLVEKSALEQLTMDERGVVTGVIRSANAEDDWTFDEQVTLTPGSSGWEFRFTPMDTSKHVTAKEFDKRGVLVRK